MKVIRVEARDIQVTIEMPLEFLKNLSKVISMSEFKYDSSDPEQVKILNFLNEELYPFVEGTIKGIEEQTG